MNMNFRVGDNLSQPTFVLRLYRSRYRQQHESMKQFRAKFVQ